MNLDNLYTAFDALPQELKDWLASEEVSNIISEINQQFALIDDKELVLPLILLRLATQSLNPESFVGELTNQLNVNEETAKKIAEEIKTKILQPVSALLNSLSIDINLTTGSWQPTTNELPVPALVENKPMPPPPANLPMTEQLERTNVLPEPETKPFILHEEKPLSWQNEESSAPSEGPTFIFKPPQDEKPTLPTTPPKVQVERIVHYNNFYTALNKSTLSKQIKIPKSKWFT